MISLFYFLRLALRNLLRGGQRVLVALLCITFGIMALVSLTMIAQSIESAILVTPAQLIGGDLSLVPSNGDVLLPGQVAQLEALRQGGKISRYTRIAYNNASIVFHLPGSGEMHFVGIGMGVEPDKYPLAGALTIGEPAGAHLPALLQQVGDMVITRDLARQYHLNVGDPLVLSDLRSGLPVKATVRGIAYDTPNHQGDKLYYTIETAQKLANGQPVVNTVIANTDHAGAAVAKLEEGGWSVNWVAGREADRPGNLWVIGLRGAGILGLLVGGVGIANTMQVLLRRRQRETAIWKTLGYRAGDLHLIFSLEAGLLGLAGSLLGAGLGALISSRVLELLWSTSSVLYQLTFSRTPPLIGVLAGTLTTVIFATWAILISGQARPVALLRNGRLEVRPLTGCLSAGLGLLLAVPFTALTSLVMGSLAAGVGMLALLGIGIALLGGFFSAALWVCARLFSWRRFPLARLAFNNLRRRRVALVFAMLALFVGVLSMSLGLAVRQISLGKISSQSIASQGYNLEILAEAGQEGAIRTAVQAQNPEKAAVGYRAALAGLSLMGGDEPLSALDPILVGRTDPADYAIRGAAWGSRPDGVYAYQDAHLKVGSRVQVTFRGGAIRTLTVVGSYEINDRSPHLFPLTGLLMPAEGFTRFARPDSITFFVQIVPSQVNRVAADLSAALPQATVVDLTAYAARYMQSYRRLYVLPMFLAGFALLAGLLLVANSVSLAMLDRRYEIGILKTVGYSPRQVLLIFSLEYGLVALLATGAGVLVIEGLLALLALLAHLPVGLLLLASPALLLIALFGVGLTLLAVFGVAWDSIRLSPVVILNEWG